MSGSVEREEPPGPGANLGPSTTPNHSVAALRRSGYRGSGFHNGVDKGKVVYLEIAGT